MSYITKGSHNLQRPQERQHKHTIIQTYVCPHVLVVLLIVTLHMLPNANACITSLVLLEAEGCRAR